MNFLFDQPSRPIRIWTGRNRPTCQNRSDSFTWLNKRSILLRVYISPLHPILSVYAPEIYSVNCHLWAHELQWCFGCLKWYSEDGSERRCIRRMTDFFFNVIFFSQKIMDIIKFRSSLVAQIIWWEWKWETSCLVKYKK